MAVAPVCQLTGTIAGVDGEAIAGAQVRATIKSTQADQGGQVAGTVPAAIGVTSDTISAISQDDGTFSLQVLQEATVVLEIPEINLRKEVVIPAEVTVDFVTLI